MSRARDVDDNRADRRVRDRRPARARRRDGALRPFGGRFVPEALVAALDELTAAYDKAKADPAFLAELDRLLRDYAGRPSPAHRGDAARPSTRAAPGSCSSARTSTTPARTRSTTCSARRC